MIVTKKCITQNDLFGNRQSVYEHHNDPYLSLFHAPPALFFLAETSETADITTEELADVLEIFIDTGMGAFGIETADRWRAGCSTGVCGRCCTT